MADLFLIAEARGPKSANVVFFQGLGGDAHGTWSADPKDKASFWPAWLAQDVEGLSVYSVGYEASVSGWNGFGDGVDRPCGQCAQFAVGES
jgi:hypothetical protein